MEFHAWMRGKLSDYERTCKFYEVAKQEFLKDRDLRSFESAINDIIEAQKGNESDLMEEVYFIRATMNFYSKNYEDSIDDYNMVLKINPRNNHAKKERGLAYSCIEDSYEAETALVECLNSLQKPTVFVPDSRP
ncbi:MAG: tetratricopeptide repeat protein [Candidatus Poribacteria bacterium]|nr:tetratricopeptide repeat protein [Candidatus Poribacteria bacterium]MDE0503005.1 tetratricopeptide repeat protein [Candidatus Poribacteria bacterium]